MLYDRNPQWTLFSDKLGVREFVDRRVGPEYLVPLLWHGDDPDELPFDELPAKFVIKTNHGCGYNVIVTDKTIVDRERIRLQLKKWLSENFCHDKSLGIAWAYRDINPTIIVESFLEVNGSVPVDYKFFCFDGRVDFVELHFDRFGEHSRRLFDRKFVPLDSTRGPKQYRGDVSAPENYREMVRVAECLSAGSDFVRVDLYSVGSRTYFGELTCYPGAGGVRFDPREYDFVVGERWNMSRQGSNSGSAEKG
jgi:hypothetical protein